MPLEPRPVPIRHAVVPAWREDDFNAALFRSQGGGARVALLGGAAEASRTVRWPGDGGRITRVRTAAWEGAQALYFDFRLHEDLHVQVDPPRELLLTFFFEGRVSGQVGSERGAPLDFRVDRALLRTPNRAGGYLIRIPGGCRNQFVQFRLRRDALPHWLQALGVRLPARPLAELMDRDDGHVLCNAALTPRVRGCLARIREEPADQPAFVPLFHARSMELLTCVLLDIERLLQRSRAAPDDAAAAAMRVAGKVRELVADAPARTWSVAELARRAGCSSASLQRSVRAATGRSVYQLVVAERLQLAAHLLRETRLDVQAVAQETGWQCHGRFTAAFRARHGVGPRDYRAAHGGEPG